MADVMMTSEQLKEHIPHRYPFLFIDAVTEMEAGEWAEGYKMVTANEWFFPGHFPGEPILPGVIMVEALAQLAAVCFLAEEGQEADLGVFTGLDGIKFRRLVQPGERLDLRIEKERQRGPFVRVTARASVDDETAVQGSMSFSLLAGDERDDD